MIVKLCKSNFFSKNNCHQASGAGLGSLLSLSLKRLGCYIPLSPNLSRRQNIEEICLKVSPQYLRKTRITFYYFGQFELQHIYATGFHTTFAKF